MAPKKISPKFAKLNGIDIYSANRLLSDFFSLLSSKNFATMATDVTTSSLYTDSNFAFL